LDRSFFKTSGLSAFLGSRSAFEIRRKIDRLVATVVLGLLLGDRGVAVEASGGKTRIFGRALDLLSLQKGSLFVNWRCPVCLGLFLNELPFYLLLRSDNLRFS
jgi:hypothetical protein